MAQRLVPKVDGGRVAVREVLINTPAVANLIRENKIAQIRNVIQTGSRLGMVTLDQSLQSAFKQNLISKETRDENLTDISLLTTE